jgi:hypothetical protein
MMLYLAAHNSDCTILRGPGGRCASLLTELTLPGGYFFDRG